MDREDAERELIAKAAGGDDRAVEELFLAYYDRLTRRLARRIPATMRSVVSEEDLLQQTFVAAYQELGGFEVRGRWAFYRWLCRIAEFRLQDAIKTHHAAKRGGGRTLPEIWVDSTEQLIDLLAGPRRTPSQSVAGREAAGVVRDALAGLRDDYRQALQLRYVQGLPVDKVAEEMGRTPHAVHNLCYRGLKELQSVMGRASQYLTRH